MSESSPIARALHRGGVIDITTTGRKSGRPRRIEIVFFHVDGHVYITGFPGTRSWVANLRADPRFTFHLKKDVVADLPATARQVTDTVERTAVLEVALRVWRREHRLEEFVVGAPLVEVVFDDESLLAA